MKNPVSELQVIFPPALLISGSIVGILIGVGKVEQQALLIICPMILLGIWGLAFNYIKRRNNVSGHNHNAE